MPAPATQSQFTDEQITDALYFLAQYQDFKTTVVETTMKQCSFNFTVDGFFADNDDTHIIYKHDSNEWSYTSGDTGIKGVGSSLTAAMLSHSKAVQL